MADRQTLEHISTIRSKMYAAIMAAAFHHTVHNNHRAKKAPFMYSYIRVGN